MITRNGPNVERAGNLALPAIILGLDPRIRLHPAFGRVMAKTSAPPSQ